MCTHVCTCMPCGNMCLCVFPVSECLSVSMFMYVSMCISMPKESCGPEARTKDRALTNKWVYLKKDSATATTSCLCPLTMAGRSLRGEERTRSTATTDSRQRKDNPVRTNTQSSDPVFLLIHTIKAWIQHWLSCSTKLHFGQAMSRVIIFLPVPLRDAWL